MSPVEDTTSPEASPAPEPAFVTGAAYGMLAVLGVALGVLGSFEFGWTVAGLPLAALGWSALNLVVFRGAGWAMRGKLGAVIPAACWLIVVVVLSSQRPEGDLVVTGTTAGYVFIFAGAIGALAAISLTPSARLAPLAGAAPRPDSRH
jgi:hypothetical protein